jgi:hypothetical protein
MKQAENKEMDLLLQNMAKQAKSVSDSGNGLQSAHLDADELSAFAARCLPRLRRVTRHTLLIVANAENS